MGQFDQTVDPMEGVVLTPDPTLQGSSPVDLPEPTIPVNAATAGTSAVPFPDESPFGGVGPQLPPVAPLSLADLGLPAGLLASVLPAIAAGSPSVQMPTAPQAPAAPGNMAHIMSAALLGLAAGLGPRGGGGGVAHGLLAGQMANEARREQVFKDQQAQYKEQQQEALRLQTIQAAQQEQRQKVLQNALLTIRTEVKTIPDKATYDQRVEGYANLLRASGYRLDANWLRQVVPYIAPSSKQVAQDAMNALFKNPLLQTQIKENPAAMASGFIMIDLNNDGIKEKHSIQDVMDAAGMAMLVDDAGKPVGLSAGTDGPIANLALKAKLAQFRTENKREPTPKEMDTLVTAARTTPKDPDLAALAKHSAELSNSLKELQLGQQPTPEQIDMYANLLLNNKMAPSQLQIQAGGMGQQGRAFLRQVQTAAMKQNPNFNFEEAESTYQLVKSPAFQNTVRYMDSVIKSAPRALETAKLLANGRVRSVNALINAGKNQFNNVDLKRFKTDVLFVSDEIAKILQGGGSGSGTSDAKLRQASEILNTSDSPAAIAGALQEASFMMGNRRGELTRGTYMESRGLADPAAATRAILDQRKAR